MSVSSISQGAVGSGIASNAASKLATDYNSFITLLVAQVKNQDPLAPMESTEFVSQLAQLTQVEQSVQVNKHMELLRQQLSLNAALSETSLLGREVTVPSPQFALNEDGATFWYKLEGPASQVQAQIRDANGVLVAIIDGLPGIEGEQVEVAWDGIGADGLPADLGNYHVSIAATDASGSVSGAYQSYSAGRVVSVDYAEGASWLRLSDGRLVASGDIVSAR